jgi:hypothetical protein
VTFENNQPRLTAYQDDSICSYQSMNSFPVDSYVQEDYRVNESSQYANSFEDPNPLKKSQLVLK